MNISPLPRDTASFINSDLDNAALRNATQSSHDTDESITLSPEQQGVLDLVKSGRNVFFTGPAGKSIHWYQVRRLSMLYSGTGKSLLLRIIISVLRSNDYRSRSIAITAPTGIAALNIGGTTIHTFAGIGLGKESAEKLITKIKGSIRPRKRWIETNVLIIDESQCQIQVLRKFTNARSSCIQYPCLTEYYLTNWCVT